MHRIYSGSITIAKYGVARDEQVSEHTSTLVEEANESTYDWEGAFASARARREALLQTTW